VAEAEDAAQAGAVGERRQHRFEPALDVALQRVVLEALVVRLVRFAPDAAVGIGGERGMPAPPVAAAGGEIGVRRQVVPAGGERGPVGQRLRWQQVAHGIGGDEGKAVALQPGMQR
jgi:hypothetical protein